LIAIMMAALVGMAALAIDGARAYALRRDLQASVDAAALAAGDNFQATGNYTSAEQAATTLFGANLKLYSSPSCSPGYGAPGGAPYTVTCTYPDGTVLTQVVAGLGPQGSVFTIAAKRTLQLQFARILTNGTNPTVAGAAAGGINNLLFTPAVAALNQAGCGGVGGVALSITGGGTLKVNGDVVSSGAISASGSGLRVAGDIYSRCQSSVPGSVTSACYPSGATAPCSYPDVVGATRPGFRFVDPNYPAPPVPGGGQPKPGNNVVLSPGSFAANPAIASGKCYFLSPGVYKWLSGYTNNGGFVSNELKPPDEPDTSNRTLPAAKQFWNTSGGKCGGAMRVTSTGLGLPMGTYGVEVTSVRTDQYGGVNYVRESAPSRCQSINAATLMTITLDISNVPGATSYNIYLSPTGCSGPFGLVFTMPVTGTMQNTDTSGCPFSSTNCTLGMETISVIGIALPLLPGPLLLAPPGNPGSYPPDGETAPIGPNLPDQNPPRGTGVTGDRANENSCQASGVGYVSCAGPVTPGAVEFYIPAGGCLNLSNSSDTYVFSGYQYNWLSVFEPGAGSPPANTCPSNTLGGGENSAFVGLVYLPAASASVVSPYTFEAAGVGGLMADTVAFSGSMPNIVWNANYSPGPPATRLIG
jgi:hypothetical protein